MEKIHFFHGLKYSPNLMGRYDDEYNAIRFYFHFKPAGFWRRIIIAITYIFKPGKFPETKDKCFILFELQQKDKTRMINLIRKLKDDR